MAIVYEVQVADSLQVDYGLLGGDFKGRVDGNVLTLALAADVAVWPAWALSVRRLSDAEAQAALPGVV